MHAVALVCFLLGGIGAIVGAIGKAKKASWWQIALYGGLGLLAAGLVIGIATMPQAPRPQ
jgi:hypothetical protein